MVARRVICGPPEELSADRQKSYEGQSKISVSVYETKLLPLLVVFVEIYCSLNRYLL